MEPSPVVQHWLIKKKFRCSGKQGLLSWRRKILKKEYVDQGSSCEGLRKQVNLLTL
jgi:hypothetical protein